MNIHELLNQFRKKITINRDLGTNFERLIKSYFQLDPIYSAKFKNVWLWQEWPKKWGPDCGIDLVAEDYEGLFYAIQCKFFAQDYEIKKADIDSFFTESDRKFKDESRKDKSFSYRIIVSTSDHWSEHAENSFYTVNNQTIPVNRIRVQDLDVSPIDWSAFSLEKPEKLVLKKKKELRQHQKEALEKVITGLKNSNRGKLIMACGTGKTFTALKIAETICKGDGTVLFLVPSLSLLSQTLREWTAEAHKPFYSYAVCSDTKVGKDKEDISKHDLVIPSTTDPKKLIASFNNLKSTKIMKVVFSTYQSIEVVGKAQKQGLPEFDLIICDEAHRTTGVILADEEESRFVRVHDQGFIKGNKRLYMTATPRIYGEGARTKAEEAGAELCSMDDPKLYGSVFYQLGFGESVGKGLLSDYKVLVLAVDEKHASKALQKCLADANKEIKLDDVVKIIGCWNGLSKKFITEGLTADDPNPMKRAVAFTSAIKISKKVAETFEKVVTEYIEQGGDENAHLRCEVKHVDGTFNVLERNEKLDWLKESPPENTCRILSNARCLSEGVDVPALDAVLFLNPRDSVIDVVQSIGRIMRRAEGKKYGYVILPIGIPAGIEPEEALKDNEKYKIVWKVLQALRAHDDRFDATINKIELNKSKPDQIQIIGVGGGSEEDEGAKGKKKVQAKQVELDFSQLEEWKDAIYAKIVLKCGSRRYWEDWASDVAKIAEKHTINIKSLLKSKDTKPKEAFNHFLKGIRRNINPSITEDDAIEMLSQQLVTRPVFDALFEHYEFTKLNPVSKAMQSVLDVLENETFVKETQSLQGFYEAVTKIVSGVNTPEGRQKIIVELYDKFFKVAFPKMAERLGIVYTPIEVVDFIIHSVEHAMKEHFKKSLSDEGVHILDPFTGTGTFIVRLLQSGIIKSKDLERKYKKELHANEIVLLAYYIAAINAEETYFGLTQKEYQPFNGAVLTDTFQMTEEETQGEMFESALPEISERVRKQKEQDISVIISNPPYSVGQTSANDNNQNLKYPKIDDNIRHTYAEISSATNLNSLYDSYIRAIRWASDRLGDQGVIGFVTNGSFIDGNAADGLRKCLTKEFSSIYCFNLRGNARTQGEDRRKERGNVFGAGTRTPVAITLLIKDSKKIENCNIFYRDIGDYLTQEEKLKIINEYGSISSEKMMWENITPNAQGDWINQRSSDFDEFIILGNKDDNKSKSIFSTYSVGVQTNRDSWVYSSNNKDLAAQINKTIRFYNDQVEIYKEKVGETPPKEWPEPEKVVSTDLKKIKWSSSLFPQVKRLKKMKFESQKIVISMYRPFFKQFLYFDSMLNHRPYLIPSLFPTQGHENIVISVTGISASKEFSALITNTIPNLHLHDTGQCFPLYYYSHKDDIEGLGIGEPTDFDKHGYIRREAITDSYLELFKLQYKEKTIKKEDLFFYIYGLLHSPEYRNKYESNLKKMLPRIPFAKNFWGFSKAGRALADWHLNYETIKPYPLKEECSDKSSNKKELYKVQKMSFGKNGKSEDRSIIIYNSKIKLTGIPLEAYDYIVNGKSAIEWVMERYAVTRDKDSGIENDPNTWSEDPRYIIDLVKRIVTVSLETMKIVNDLPKLEIIKMKKEK